MKLSIIGMSGIGKTFWSKKLVRKGFKRFCCDDLIEERLNRELKALGFSGIKDVAKWMGHPFDVQYSKTSKKYLNYEREILKELIAKLENSADANIVVDTTGSVIYLEGSILRKLAKITKIVYLETPQSVIQKMFEVYINDPKPVIWGKSYKKKQGENELEALKRCYPKLLKCRSDKYKKLAQITFGHGLLRENFTVEDFVQMVKK